jgi:hypothetical protein
VAYPFERDCLIVLAVGANGRKHFAHAAATQLRHEIVRADPLPHRDLASTSERLDIAREFRNRLFQELRIRLVGAQHRLDFAPRCRVVAVVGEPALPLGGRTHAGIVEERRDARPLLAVHRRATSPSR